MYAQNDLGLSLTLYMSAFGKVDYWVESRETDKPHRELVLGTKRQFSCNGLGQRSDWTTIGKTILRTHCVHKVLY